MIRSYISRDDDTGAVAGAVRDGFGTTVVTGVHDVATRSAKSMGIFNGCFLLI